MKYVDIVCRCLAIALVAEMLRDEWAAVEVVGFLSRSLITGGLFYAVVWLPCYVIRGWIARHRRVANGEVLR